MPNSKNDRGFFAARMDRKHRCYSIIHSKVFPGEVCQAWGISDEDFEEIKSQLVGNPLPPARMSQNQLEQKGYTSWGHYKAVAVVRAS